MRRSVLKTPSSGLVLACVALFVALGGGAVAATSSDTKKDQKIAKKAAKAYFNGHIGAASVSHANTASIADGLKQPTFVPLNLINGWASAGQRTPGYIVDADRVVHFVGAIQRNSGSSDTPFTMPAALAPAPQHVDLVVDENGGATGRIFVNTDGTVNVQDDPATSGSAGLYTSLEGVTYVAGNAGATASDAASRRGSSSAGGN